MINPDLERRYADCSTLVEEWGSFLDLVNRGMKQPDTVTPQLEQQFLAVKARIAMLHDSLMESLKSDKATGNKMLEIVNRSITLKALRKVSEPEQKKTESEWHECFLLLNETVVGLNEERARLANINEFAHKMGKAKESLFAFIGKLVTSALFKIAAGLVILLVVLIGVQLAGIYNYDNLRDVRSLSAVVRPYLNVTRAMGLGTAFYEVGDVSARLKAPDGLQVRQNVGDFNKERAADIFASFNLFNNSKLGDLLKGAQGYDRLTFTRGDGTGAPCDVYVFWYRKSADARTAAREAKVKVPDRVAVENRSNVVILIQSQDAELLNQVRSGSVRKI